MRATQGTTSWRMQRGIIGSSAVNASNSSQLTTSTRSRGARSTRTHRTSCSVELCPDGLPSRSAP
eukprot:12897351-Prorocentrum_lima.AAC.1